MGLFYLFTVIGLCTTFLLFKKSSKQLNLVNQLFFTIVLLICFNSFIAYFLSLIHIPITMFSLSLFNIIIIISFSYFIRMNGKQEYFIDKIQVIICLVIAVIALTMGLLRTDFFNQISYETTDPATHYAMAFDFYRSHALLTKETVFSLYNGFELDMTLAYVNVGLLFKSVSGFVAEYTFYKLFLFFDVCMLILAGEVFFCSIYKYINKKKALFPTFIVITLFYLFGYPFNNYLFGFFYLGMTIICINIIMAIFSEFKNIDFNNKKNFFYISIVLFLINYAIFFGYYLFVPVVYAAEFIYIFFYHYNKRKKIISKEYVLFNTIALFLPFILGFIYFFVARYFAVTSSGKSFNPLLSEGYIYRDLYSNFLLLVPFSLYYLFTTFKEKKLDFVSILLTIILIFVIGLLGLGLLGKVATYYYYKNYFILSLVMFFVICKVLQNLCNEKNIAFINSCLITLVCVFLAFSFGFDEKIIARNLLFNPTPKLNSYFDIFVHNKIYYKREVIFDKEELKAIKFYEDNKKIMKTEDGMIPVQGELYQRYWFYSITRTIPNYYNTGHLADLYNDELTFDIFKESDYTYYISFKTQEELKLKDSDLIDFNILYENSSSFILERK